MNAGLAPHLREVGGKAMAYIGLASQTTFAELLQRCLDDELADAWTTAWQTGPRRREKMDAGRERLSDKGRAAIDDVLARSQTRRSGRQGS